MMYISLVNGDINCTLLCQSQAAAMFKVLHKNPTIPESLSNDAKDFLQCCFCRNPAERPTANMLLEHSFIQLSDHYNGHGSLQAFAGIKIIVSVGFFR